MAQCPSSSAFVATRAGAGQHREPGSRPPSAAIICECSRSRPTVAPFDAAYITAAYWFTATSFANPAVTLLSPSGIRPVDAPGFIVAELAGAATATLFFRWLVKIYRRLGRPGGRGRSAAEGHRDLRLCAQRDFEMAGRVVQRTIPTRALTGRRRSRGIPVRCKAAMSEIGMRISPSQARSCSPTRTMQDAANATGLRDACPYVPGLRRDDWPLEDPKNKPVERVREIRGHSRYRARGTRPPGPARAAAASPSRSP